MPRPEWSFFMPAQDHMRLKWFLSFIGAKLTIWGQIIFGMVLVGMSVSSVGTQISAYYFVSLVWALFFTAYFLSLFFKPNVHVTRTCMPTATAGDIYSYRVIITNNSKKPLRNIGIYLHHLPYGLYETTHEADKRFIDWLEPSKQVTFTIRLHIPRRGYFVMPPLMIGTSFPSGLLRSLVNAGEPATLTVFPKQITINDPSLLAHTLSLTEGNGTSSSFGNANEFLSTREYRDGDRMRDIHWNTSARQGKLIVKEYIHENACRVGLFVDCELKRFEKHVCFETRIALCSGIAQDFYKQNYHVDLFLNDDSSKKTNPTHEQNNFNNLLERLSHIEGVNHVNFAIALTQIKSQRNALSTLILFLKDWDHTRSNFVKVLKEYGIPFKIIIVRDKPLSFPTNDPMIAVYTPKQLGFTL
jgi:uncharacterized protein (DUF58 family)